MSENYTHINDEHLAGYLLEELSDNDRRAVEAWLAADPANQVYFNQFKKVWDGSRALATGGYVDEEAAWHRFRSRIQLPARKATAPSMQWMKIAAIFIVIVGATVLALQLFRTETISTITAQASNEVINETLPDGSVITLNKNSSLSYPEKFKGDTRSVTLKGEAFFNVRANRKRPFIIHVNDVSITVVGTSFNVKSENGRTEVIVETGIVRVAKKNQVVELRPKEKITIAAQDSVLQKVKEEEQLHNYYRTKEFVCDNTPLWKLVDVLNEAYGVQIVLERKELRSLPISTTFSNESLDKILDIIAMTFKLRIQRTGDEIILR